MADFEDREFVEALGVNLDTLLIFAGLFSAVNTPFIIEALKTLQTDRTRQTNDLIRSVIFILHNQTFLGDSLHNETSIATPRAFRTTAVFFSSLTFSLTTASGAVMAKQWLNYYEREGVLKTPPARGRERQRKFNGRNQWNMKGVIETLPTLLQISLFLFLTTLVDSLWSVQTRLAYIVMAFSLVPVIFYAATTTIAAIDPISPFQTSLSISIRHLCCWIKDQVDDLGGRLKHASQYPSDLKDVTNIECLSTYTHRASIPQDLAVVLAALESLPINQFINAHQSLVKSLVKDSIKLVLTLPPCWSLQTGLQHYFPYLTLLFAPTTVEERINPDQISRIIPALTSSMWADDKADMDFKNGEFRLEVLPARLDDASDKYRFSQFLLEWRKGRNSNDGPPRNEAYLKSAAKVLYTHPDSLYWTKQLEKGGHHATIVQIIGSKIPYEPSLHALYAFLTLWHRRGDTAPSKVYIEQEAVYNIVSVWEGLDSSSQPCDSDGLMQDVMMHTASYLEEAKNLQRFKGQSLERFVRHYKRAGERYMQGDERLPSLYEWTDALALPHI